MIIFYQKKKEMNQAENGPLLDNFRIEAIIYEETMKKG